MIFWTRASLGLVTADVDVVGVDVGKLSGLALTAVRKERKGKSKGRIRKPKQKADAKSRNNRPKQKAEAGETEQAAA